MERKIIQKTIEINAAADKVWNVFTDTVVTRQMGGEYMTDWKVGSSLGWKGNDGSMYTSGKIMALEKGRLIKHSLFDTKQKEKIVSVITYRFVENQGKTTLYGQEELNVEMNAEQYNEALKGWDFALAAVKETAEKL